MKKIIILLMITFLILGCSSKQSEDTTMKKAIITTNVGTIEIELFTDKAPLTTKNFMDLSG